MPTRPADLYLSLHDDGPALAVTSTARRLAALAFAVLLLAAVPLIWAANDALATSGPKATLASDDEDNSGPGSGGDDDDDDEPTTTGTQSSTATNSADTGTSTKQGTATQSNTATRTG